MNEGGSENATETLAVHDSAATAVVVPLGAGGPGIGRRAARPPRTKNPGICRARDDARRGAPPRTTRPGRYRADQREMPRRPSRKLDSRFRTGFALRLEDVAQVPRLRRRRRPHPGPRCRRQHRHLQLHRRRALALHTSERSARTRCLQLDRPCTPETPRPKRLWRLRGPNCHRRLLLLHTVLQNRSRESWRFLRHGRVRLYVSGDFFSTLGVSTFIGRTLTPSDDSPSAPPAIVFNYAYWVRAFGAAPSVVGRTVRLDSTTVTIVGVADPHFTNLTPGKPLDLFMPFSVADSVRGKWYRSKDRLADPTNWWVVILGRLKPGVSISQAQADATTIFRNEMLHGAAPLSKPEDAPAITLRPARSGLNGEASQIAPVLYATMVIVAFILLIACANVAGLTLARSASRQKEIAVRLALGAGRARIIRQLLTESVLLAAAGGALGVLVAVWGVDAIASLLSNGSGEPFPFAVAPDWRVLLFTLAITFLAGILFGLAPSLRRSRVDLTPSLKENASSLPGAAAHTGRRFRLGDGL